jgi:hypothetical protein
MPSGGSLPRGSSRSVGQGARQSRGSIGKGIGPQVVGATNSNRLAPERMETFCAQEASALARHTNVELGWLFEHIVGVGKPTRLCWRWHKGVSPSTLGALANVKTEALRSLCSDHNITKSAINIYNDFFVTHDLTYFCQISFFKSLVDVL